MIEKVDKVILNTSGYDSFINLCEKEKVLTRDIEKLLSNKDYTKAIMLMGENWGIPNKKQWIEYFSLGFQCNDSNINVESLSTLQLMGVEHIKKARSNINKINDTKQRIEKLIMSREFIIVASNYIPYSVKEDLLEVIILVFIPNAGGNKSIIIDVPFLMNYNNSEITKILAHELHHLLRSKVEKQYKWKEEFYGIEQALYWLESEGIANLCNFVETAKLYLDYGYAQPGQLSMTLQNISDHIKQINEVVLDILKGEKKSREMVQYLSKDVKFHAIGYFLAKTIRDTFGNRVVSQVVGDPIEFIKIYQKACEVNGNKEQYGFSDEMLDLIHIAYK